MPADNWGVCPRCLTRKIREYDKLSAQIHASYGNVPVEEFDTRRKELGERPSEDAIEPTLREDYEMSTDAAGEFSVTYSCRCGEVGCHFRHTFRHKEQLPVYL